MLNTIGLLQILFIPGLVLLTIWTVYLTFIKKDRAVGMALYLGVVIIVDSYLDTGIYVPGMAFGSIKYSEPLGIFLIVNNLPKRSLEKSDKLIMFLIFMYFVFLLFASIRSIDEKGMIFFRRLIVPQILTFVIFSRGFLVLKDYKRFFSYFMILLLLISLLTFWDAIFDRVWIHTHSLTKNVYITGRKHGRFGSFFLNPNYMGTFCCLVFVTVLMTTFIQKNIKQRLFNWIILLLFCFAALKTQSRGGHIGLAISLLIFFIIPSIKLPLNKKAGYLISFVLILFLLLPGAYNVVTNRFYGSEINEYDDGGGVTRKNVWRYTRGLISENPVFGIGFGEEPYIRHILSSEFVEEHGGKIDNPHNSYLEIAAAAGIPTLIVFLTFNALLIKKVILNILKQGKQEYTFYLSGFVCGLIGYLFSIIFGGSIFVMSTAPPYWAVFGLLFSLLNFERRLKSDEGSNINLRDYDKQIPGKLLNK